MEAVVAVLMKHVIVMGATNKPFHLKWSALEERMRAFALQNHVPIIVEEGLAFLEQIIRIQRPKKILEIGTAIGYSAIRMHQVCNSEIYTIERNKEMVLEAMTNIEASGFKDHIHLIEADALEAFSCVEKESFDLIFIDAAKAQYTKFFELYTPLLVSHGIVVTDNMGFHGLVQEEGQGQSRAVRGLIRKLQSYQEYLLNNERYITSVFSIGDGMAVSIKKD